MKRNILCLLFLTMTCAVYSYGQSFYDINTIQKIEISFTQSNWDYILDTAKQGSDTYTMSKWVKINGMKFDSAGVKYKGNSSYNPANLKNPIHIELDHFIDQDYQGVKDIKLSNGYHEPSFVREVMLYSMFRQYADAGDANFAQVYINGEYYGVYSNVEAVTNTFLQDEYYSNNGTFIFADNGGCDFRYKGNDSTLYYTPYTMKSDYGFANLMHLCDTLRNNLPGMENILDVDRTLWIHAYCNAMVILDSYLGASKHNFYMYQDHNGRFNPIIWDLNGGLGVFNKPNTGVNLTVSEMQVMTPMLHATDTMWPLMKSLMDVPMFSKMYIAHMKTIMNENIQNNYYYTFAQQLQNLIDTAVLSDTKKFSSYTDFHNNLTTNIVIGPKTIPGLSLLMDARNTFLNSTPEFMNVAPVIVNHSASVSNPPIGSNVYVTANVTGANAVYIGTRAGIMNRFMRQMMFDDGLHGDGGAGDNVFGVQLAMNTPQIQYYIYAENTNAGIFSPERAEHEYFVLNAQYNTMSVGAVVINEILATNNSVIANGDGVYGDWIELYNTTSSAVNMDYVNLSDDFSNTTKWTFPSGVIIPANGYQIVWAENTSSTGELNSEFKLLGSGEATILSYPNGLVIDSVSFPVQFADTSYGRYPNGSGPFSYMYPTFNAVNSPFGIPVAQHSEVNYKLYPNPSTGRIQIKGVNEKTEKIMIVDQSGKKVYEGYPDGNELHISLPAVSGVYVYEIEETDGRREQGKLIILRKN